MTDPILVLDIGTTGLRAALVRDDATVDHLEYRPFAPNTPAPGLVEFDADLLGRIALDAVDAVLARDRHPAIRAVGIANQRASTIVWNRHTGEPIGPALGWQDLRTVGECLAANADHGLSLAPNQPATKIAWLLRHAATDRDPADLCVGTVDSWMAWVLSGGSVHVTDRTNAAMYGLATLGATAWDESICSLLDIDPGLLPDIVDTTGIVGTATAVEGAPPIGALVGDQQASLVGQGCVRPGLAKITFGTGGMLDLCTGPDATPVGAQRSAHGTFPIVAWSEAGRPTWGVEAIMLAAGTNIDWLRDDLGLIESAADSHTIAAACDDPHGVVYVPAPLGLGTPRWDYGARGTLLGLTRGSERRHVVRAVLEGIAHRGADLVDAAEADTGIEIPSLRIDGGMSANPTFVQALADATGKPIDVSPISDATTLGAGLLAGTAAGVWTGVENAASQWTPAHRIDPVRTLDRSAWAAAVDRAAGWHPGLSAIDF